MFFHCDCGAADLPDRNELGNRLPNRWYDRDPLGYPYDLAQCLP
jgi:hypothetical protein